MSGKILCNLHRAFARNAEREYLLNNGSSFRVDFPTVFVTDITIRNICAKSFTVIALVVENGPDFFTGITGIKFIEQFPNSYHIIKATITVNIVRNSNIADVEILCESLHQCTDSQAITA